MFYRSSELIFQTLWRPEYFYGGHLLDNLTILTRSLVHLFYDIHLLNVFFILNPHIRYLGDARVIKKTKLQLLEIIFVQFYDVTVLEIILLLFHIWEFRKKSDFQKQILADCFLDFSLSNRCMGLMA